MNGALRVDFNYCSVEVGIGHALNWNETHFSPQQGREENGGYLPPSSGTKFSQNCANANNKGSWERNSAHFYMQGNYREVVLDLYDVLKYIIWLTTSLSVKVIA